MSSCGETREDCCDAVGEVRPADYDAVGQAVIAGTPEAIEVAAAVARDLDAMGVMSPQVGGALRTPFMASARDPLTKAADRTAPCGPEGTVVGGVDGAVHGRGAVAGSVRGLV
jgi:[acyl-carrier-protein] S-malonyltransferase